jgi:anti-anti-sigma factor
MYVEHEIRNGVAIVSLKGRIDAQSAPGVNQEIDAVVTDGVNKMVISCKELEYISSAGLRVLITVAKKLKAAQGSLVLCDLDEKVLKVFEVSGFTAIFNICDGEEEALSTLGA